MRRIPHLFADVEPTADERRSALPGDGLRRVWLAEHGGGLFDLLTVAGLAAGLRERVRGR